MPGAPEFVDADAHVIEGPVLGAEYQRRWPEAFTAAPRGALRTENVRRLYGLGPCP